MPAFYPLPDPLSCSTGGGPSTRRTDPDVIGRVPAVRARLVELHAARRAIPRHVLRLPDPVAPGAPDYRTWPDGGHACAKPIVGGAAVAPAYRSSRRPARRAEACRRRSPASRGAGGTPRPRPDARRCDGRGRRSADRRSPRSYPTAAARRTGCSCSGHRTPAGRSAAPWRRRRCSRTRSRRVQNSVVSGMSLEGRDGPRGDDRVVEEADVVERTDVAARDRARGVAERRGVVEAQVVAHLGRPRIGVGAQEDEPTGVVVAVVVLDVVPSWS